MSSGKSIKIYFSIFIAILVLSGVTLFIKIENSIFPFDKNTSIEISSYHEPVDSLFSKAEITQNKDFLSLHYHLSAQLAEPFVGMYFHKNSPNDPFFQLANYNVISVYITSSLGKRIPITYTVDYPGFTKKEQELTNIPYTAILDYKGEGWYDIPLTEFKKQSWWFREHQLKEDQFPNINLNRVNYLVIGSCQILGNNGKDTITLKGIKFKKDKTTLFYYWLAFVIVGGTVGIMLIIYKREKKVLIPYIPQEVENGGKDKLSLIKEYVAKNYPNPDLSQLSMQKDLGISSREIGLIIKEQLNSNFKNYLNMIRLAEVKRLLLETELPVSDIAYRTGYSNISHFNRVFKQETGLNPKQFRENPN